MLRFPRSLFQRALCAVYVAAFVSIRAQIRGLYGEDGLEPVVAFLDRLVKADADIHAASSTLARFWAYPTLVWLHAPLQWSPSFAMEVICLAGATLAMLGVCSASWRTALPLALVWLCYLSIVQCGQTFMRFQWDSFLLEVGFLAIWIAPWWHEHQLEKHPASTFETPAAGVWNLRFLFFKFMFMSGSVKIQSKCPTWLGLTALEFHYATQPLPLPLAWYAHQLPPVINRFAVAATLLIEGPWTFFILAPHLTLRRFAAATQVLLQIVILLTGNYNFFNILTVVMALSVLDVSSIDDETRKASGAVRSAIDTDWIARADSAWQRFQTSHGVAVLMWTMTALYCIYSAVEIFDVSIDLQSPIFENLLATTTIRFVPTVEDVQAWIARVLPVSVIFAACIIATASMWQMLRAAKSFMLRSDQRRTSTIRNLLKLVYLLTCTIVNVWVFLSSVLTVSILDRPYQSSMPPFVLAAYEGTEKYRVTSPYGLFRTMTGVGSIVRDGERVSVVARPEIILEGTSDDGRTWQELHFTHKPGDVYARPSRAMPMQPRLDWQMWFAALGEYRNAPWLVHLVHKLLEGSGDVKELLDTSRDPFPDAPPQAIRARLYYYDFTRSDSAWSRGNTHPAFTSVSRKEETTSGDDDAKGSKALQQPWWSRVFAREYLPALERGNPSLQSFVTHHYGARDSATRKESEFQCSRKVLATQGWRTSTICQVLETLVQSEYSPFGLAATVLFAKFASSWVLQTAPKLWLRLREAAATKQKLE